MAYAAIHFVLKKKKFQQFNGRIYCSTKIMLFVGWKGLYGTVVVSIQSLNTLGASCWLSNEYMYIYMYIKISVLSCFWWVLLHVPVTLHSDVKESTSIQRSCSLQHREYQVLLYIHDLRRETSSWRDGKYLGLIFINKVWGSISYNRAGAGLEDRLASVTCGPALGFSALRPCTAGVG